MMQDYTKKQKYIDTQIAKGDFKRFDPHTYERVQVEPFHPIYGQCQAPFSETMFKFPTMPLYVGRFELDDEALERIDLNVLRLMIRKDDPDAPIFLPKKLKALAPLLLQNINYHRQYFPANADCFLYLTVRVSTFDELYYRNSSEWHIDGFQGARLARHKVEQNMFWSNVNPTEFSIQPYFCEGINPRIHDINEFFNRKTNPALAVKAVENGMYFVNPYHVHRVCPEEFEGKRVFIRLNFSPVVIEDTTNSVNPHFDGIDFPIRVDVRNFLHEYQVDETVGAGLRPTF